MSGPPRPRARRARLGVGLILAVVLATLVVAAPAPDVGAVPVELDTTVTSPADRALLPVGPVTLRGTAEGPAGVTVVALAVQDPVTRHWLQADGSWGSWGWLTADVAAPGALTTTWSFVLPSPRAGAYSAFVEARGPDGSRDTTRAVHRLFLGTAPDGGITTPAAGAASPAPVTISGWATDDVGVRSVRLAIQDVATRRWWGPGGWGPFGWLGAQVTGIGTPSATWRWSWPETPSGSYGVFVEVIDVDGLPDPSRAMRRLDVVDGGPAFLTLLIGRSDWAVAEGCATAPGAVTLDRVAEALTARGLRATGGVVVDDTVEVGTGCSGGVIQTSSWAQLDELRREHGWVFVPRSSGPVGGLDPVALEQATCGARRQLEAHGHDRARGLFAYANNAVDDVVQASVVAQCFAFGRRYGDGVTTRDGAVAPFWQRTRSFNGGRCNDPTAACAGIAVPNDRVYESPDLLAQLMSPAPGVWRTVQLYRFVEGASVAPGNQWDCTSADWRQHWTSRPEVYCWVDYLSALDRIPAGVTVTDPLTVAVAWQRVVDDVPSNRPETPGVVPGPSPA